MAFPPHTPLVLLAAIVAASVGAFAWLLRDTPGAKPLAVFMVGASLWSLAEGIALASPTLEGKVVWTRLAWSVSPLVPLGWLAAVLAYVDHDWQLTRRRLALLVVEPVVFVALVWTNAGPGLFVGAGHELVWTGFSKELVAGYVAMDRSFGLAFWAHTGYSYLLIAVGGAVIVSRNFRTTDAFRGTNTALLAAAVVPMVANAVSVFGLVPPEFDLTSLGFVVSGVVVAGAVFRGTLLSVAPVTRELGRDAVVDGMDDPVIIVDDDDHVVDLNPAAERLLGVETGTVLGDPFAAVDAALAGAVDGLDSGQTELERDTPAGGRYFDVRVSSLSHGSGTTRGRVVSLRDVTGRRQREQRLDVLNRLLRHNLRNEMNVVGGNAELLRDHFEDDDARSRIDRIQETVDTIVERSDKIGHLSRDVEYDPTEQVPLARLVETVVERVADRAPSATLEVDVPPDLTVAKGSSLELAVEELLDNAVTHSDRPDPTIEVSARVEDGTIALSVADDGPGIEHQERVVIEKGRETALEHGSGVGLWLVAWVTAECGGSVEFADRTDGCTVVLNLPGGRRGSADTTDSRSDHANVSPDTPAQ